MATPKRAWGYRFEPQPGVTEDEVMQILKICLRVISNNLHLSIGPRKEIEELPPRLKRHFQRSPM